MPLSVKGAPKVDYKNIKLLKRYVSEMENIAIKNKFRKSKTKRTVLVH